MTFVLRRWDFDMDSAVLGPVRCANLNVESKFAEYEAAIRAGAIDSTEFARDVFRTVAHRRTGDSVVDGRCGGEVFTEEEVATVPMGELDLFCDKLLLGSMRRVAVTAGSGRLPAAPSLGSGREGLAPALLHAAEHDRAAWMKAVETTVRSVDCGALTAAESKSDLLAAAGGDAAMRAVQEIYRNEDIINASLGLSAKAHIQHSEDMVRTALGHSDLTKAASALASTAAAFDMHTNLRSIQEEVRGAFSGNDLQILAGIGGSRAAIEAASGFYSAGEAVRRAAFGPDIRDLARMGPTSSALDAVAGLRSVDDARLDVIDPAIRNAVGRGGTGPERGSQLDPSPSVEVFRYRTWEAAPNPIEKTNVMMGELLAHQKSEAAKKEADRVEAKADSGDNKQIATSGLWYTKAGFWISLLTAFVVPAAAFLWAHFGKVDALESERKSATEIIELRAEIHALKASVTAPQKPANSHTAQKPGRQANSK